MNIKLKKTIIPFILMLIFNLSVYSIFNLNYGAGMHPHIGIIFISGLLFGPYGALGASLGNLICDLFRGYSLIVSLISFIITFGVSLLTYKLWYEQSRNRTVITKPKLNNTAQFIYFIIIIIVSASIYAIAHQEIFLMFAPDTRVIIYNIGFRYWLNFINSSFIMGIVGIWISQKIDFVHVPQKSEREINKKLYYALGILLVISVIGSATTDYLLISVETLLIIVLLYSYLSKPIVCEVKEIDTHSISEKIMNNFLVATLIILIFAYIISGDSSLTKSVVRILPMQIDEIESSIMIFADLLLAVFLIPSLGVLRYIENTVIKPITKFSQIEEFINEGDKIESEGLLKTYAEYDNEENEIGDLARSYTELIQHNNNYIENIREIEGERERIRTELNIAEKIQRANLPTICIENEKYQVYGYSEPAKEVGGDFFDYYAIDDENLLIAIGDASGKGIPAALLSSVTQSLIKQKAKSTRDPSKILESLNNQLCENNPELMFITLWLGIYNEKTNKLRYSNAGHAHPFIKENGEFKKLEVDNGIAIGILENFEYKSKEISIEDVLFLYSDGITDARNSKNDFYGEDNLIEFLNNADFTKNMVDDLLNNINEFTKGEEQYDDMTVLALVKKKED